MNKEDCPYCDRCVLPRNMFRHQRRNYCRSVYERKQKRTQEEIDIDDEDAYISKMTEKEQLRYFEKLTEQEYDFYIWRRIGVTT
jgi:hypothetical protein